MSSGHKLMVQNFRVLDADKNVNKQIQNRIRKERCSKIFPDSFQHNFFRSLKENVEDIVSYSFRTKQVSLVSRFFQSYSVLIYKLTFFKKTFNSFQTKCHFVKQCPTHQSSTFQISYKSRKSTRSKSAFKSICANQ